MKKIIRNFSAVLLVAALILPVLSGCDYEPGDQLYTGTYEIDEMKFYWEHGYSDVVYKDGSIKVKVNPEYTSVDFTVLTGFKIDYRHESLETFSLSMGSDTTRSEETITKNGKHGERQKYITGKMYGLLEAPRMDYKTADYIKMVFYEANDTERTPSINIYFYSEKDKKVIANVIFRRLEDEVFVF